MKKSILLLAIALIYSQNSFSQLRGWDINGFTPVEEIEVLHDFKEINNLHKGELIFSKARGAFSISAINAINNRALLKLKTEASMKGASHIFIDYRNIENSVFSKTSMYSATLYKKIKLDLSEVKNKLDGKTITFTIQTTYDRNKSGSRVGSSKIGSKAMIVSDPIEKNGKVIIKINSSGSSNVNKAEEYEIIALEDDLMLLLEEKTKDKSMVLFGVTIK
ncbi:hypothetical protein [Belliella aquatica]|uniref:Uncharacterized protein n=1 Tax=Belliella aquatica TaxID=1323734 RepID=A0ABQ1MP56_9BACT|nr:hypothetical protein [Belliella aquatica]MCH7405910.1 hypothetical protein [Belliella aquatica]GGC44180.1 hypothetical protein GCM10010993_23390 [Belliella aquatica]